MDKPLRYAATRMTMTKKDWASLNDGSPLAIVRANWDGFTGDVVAVVWSTVDDMDTEAEQADAMKTAKLLAAAPEMLEALKAAETMLGVLPETSTNWLGKRPDMTTRRALEAVQAAIFEAEGR